MPSVAELLDRESQTVDLEHGDFERLLRRRERKQRNRRIGAGALALALMVLGTAVLLRAFQPDHTPADRPVQPAPMALGALAYGVDGDIYVADSDGSNPVRIAGGSPVDGAGACGEPEHRAIVFGTAWSPDGRYLAYWGDWDCPFTQKAWGTVVITDPDGNLVASFPAQGWTISWSPDSTRVAVWDSWGQGDATIGVYGLDGVRQAALTVPASLRPSGDYSPVWSRDGASILLPGVQVPLDGGTPRKLPADDLTHHWGAAYSPDGSRVAYYIDYSNQGCCSSNEGSIVVADADGPDAQEVGGPTEFWDAAWSPSGDRIAFVHDYNELRMKDVTTGTVTSLIRVEGSGSLRVIEFSPDGDQIFFSRREDRNSIVSSLWSVNADGSDPSRLVTRIEWADWRPQGSTR
jgi:Tol biopolymer transport system component